MTTVPTGVRPSPAPMLCDAALLLMVGVVALSPLGDVFTGRHWVVTVLVGLGLGVGVTLLGIRLAWGPLLHLLALVVGYLSLGPAAAVPAQAAGALLPSLASEKLLLLGSFQSWRSVLTMPTPVGEGRGELIVPFLTACLMGLITSLVLWRSRRPGVAWMPVAVAFGVAAAFGGRVSDLPVQRGLVLVMLLLLWLRWRELRLSRKAWMRRATVGGAVLAVTSTGAWAVASAGETSSRDVLRDHVDPPLAQLDLKSPLARYRDYYKSHETDVLFRFSKLPGGEPLVRLASMDAYDGSVWNVTALDRHAGTSQFRQAPFGDTGDSIEVTVEHADGPWVPTVGTATGAWSEATTADEARDLLLNPDTGAVAVAGGVREGDVLTIEWEPRPDRNDDLTAVPVDADVAVPPMDVPAIEALDTLTQRRVARSGAASAYEKVESLEQMFRDEGFFNDGLTPRQRGYSASGHSARRLADLAADPERMVGNDEQYAAALAYAVQRLGIPARVVLGFERVSNQGTVTGDDIAAWVEVPFTGHGWVAFDPTPPEDREPPPLQDNPNPLPQPYVVQPPVLPQEPGEVDGVPPAGAGRDTGGDALQLLWTLLLWTGRVGVVALALSPLWGVVLAKHLRRRRRLRADDPLHRLSGAWREVTDRARDLGASQTTTATRRESALVLASRFPECGSVALAATADHHVFGPWSPSDDEVTSYWTDVDTALQRMRAATPWWRRTLALFSPVSLPWAATGARARMVAQSATRQVSGLAHTGVERLAGLGGVGRHGRHPRARGARDDD